MVPEGFTDWVNVDRARPLYSGHAQPVEPGELGRYDLSDVKVMHQQADLAADHGIDGFVMYRYWFDGRSLLDTPRATCWPTRLSSSHSLCAGPTKPGPGAGTVSTGTS